MDNLSSNKKRIKIKFIDKDDNNKILDNLEVTDLEEINFSKTLSELQKKCYQLIENTDIEKVDKPKTTILIPKLHEDN